MDAASALTRPHEETLICAARHHPAVVEGDRRGLRTGVRICLAYPPGWKVEEANATLPDHERECAVRRDRGAVRVLDTCDESDVAVARDDPEATISSRDQSRAAVGKRCIARRRLRRYASHDLTGRGIGEDEVAALGHGDEPVALRPSLELGLAGIDDGSHA
jgi:hypothetical protein